MAQSEQLARLQRRLEAIPRKVKEDVVPALLKSGNELAGMQRQLAPEDTGALKESIVVTPPGGQTPAYSQPGGSQIAGENEVLVTVGNSDVRYAHLPEFGTVNAPAQPYFWPAFRLLKKRIQRRIKTAIGKSVKEGFTNG